ncbi:hypothetical protein Fmac_015718 [Flemingia macrophylla]|uniref:Uncharacterized protein n=1 Tax=Flemingia macrophylla TaxID=520843 RepID=A0ABD1MHG5_9FABA
MARQTSSLDFTVRRKSAELVAPAIATPHELKQLSGIDNQHSLRHHHPLIQFYRHQPLMAGKDPVEVIKQALAKTLVFYYPLAGRPRESPNGELKVECNGEGVTFIEADADVTLDQFGDNLMPPFPCVDKLLYNVPDSHGATDSPLLLLQVTRLKCGGFIFALSFNHSMCDAFGISQFLNALAEISCGALKPSILPVWCREILCARDPPRITRSHREFQQEIPAIRALLPHDIATKSSSFEVPTAWLWRCRTKSLEWQNPGQEGNAWVCPAAVTTVEKLLGHPLEYALELVKNVKYETNEEYVHSVIDLLATKGGHCYPRLGSFIVSDQTKVGFTNVDFGWGKALYIGVAKCDFGDLLAVSVYVQYTNSKGEQGKVVSICLPQYAMDKFEREFDNRDVFNEVLLAIEESLRNPAKAFPRIASNNDGRCDYLLTDDATLPPLDNKKKVSMESATERSFAQVC